MLKGSALILYCLTRKKSLDSKILLLKLLDLQWIKSGPIQLLHFNLILFQKVLIANAGIAFVTNYPAHASSPLILKFYLLTLLTCVGDLDMTKICISEATLLSPCFICFDRYIYSRRFWRKKRGWSWSWYWES